MPDRIYTRTGDAGETGLFGGGRVSKASPRVEAYGAMDELNAAIGSARAALEDLVTRERLALLQGDLFVLGAHLATPPARPGRRAPVLPPLPDRRAAELEQWIDEAAEELPPLASFILPGGSAGGAALHLARTICRRAERRVVALAAGEPVAPEMVPYLNRLSDYLFMAARLVNQRAGRPEQPWEWRSSPGP